MRHLFERSTIAGLAEIVDVLAISTAGAPTSAAGLCFGDQSRKLEPKPHIALSKARQNSAVGRPTQVRRPAALFARPVTIAHACELLAPPVVEDSLRP